MARIAGIDLNDTWKVDYALTRIKGIGWALSKKILTEVGVDKARRVGKLTPQEISEITGRLDSFPTGGELERIVRQNIARLTTIGSYRGIRHTKSLPVRGQRTRSNARTKRGKRKTVGAFKKEALAKMGTKSGAGQEGKKESSSVKAGGKA